MKKIVFWDPSYLMLLELTYEELYKWGYSETSFVLLFGEESSISKITLRTYQGTAIVHAITTIIGLKLGKFPKPNLLVQSNMRQYNRESVFFKRCSVYPQGIRVQEEIF